MDCGHAPAREQGPRAVNRVLLAATLLSLAACSSGQAASNATTSTTRPAPSSARSSATIDTFVVPASVQCRGATSTVVPIRYAVTGSARRELAVDGLTGPALAEPKGIVRTPVHCDDLQHTAVLIAVDAHGARTTREETFATVTSGP
jgi:hypothetical protein